MPAHNRSIIEGALVGALAGFAASFLMNQFQAAAARLQPQSGGSDDDPATVKAAERVVGHAIPKDAKAAAGNQVHYAFGVFLGVVYGVGAALVPVIRSGFGVPYGVAVALIADETMVPALRLSGPPWKSPASTHAYSLTSHIVFGGTLEAARRILTKAGALL